MTAEPDRPPPKLTGRASLTDLAALCHRIAVSLDAGVDVRRVWRSESERARGNARRVYAAIADGVAAGNGFDAAVRSQAGYFPRLFVDMAEVGEATGSTPEVFRRLAGHYDHLVATRRDLLSRLAWPAFQLAIALAVVAALIAVGGFVNDGRGEAIDLLGLGLVGGRGLMIYANALIALALMGLGGWVAITRSRALSSFVWRFAAGLPVVGDCLNKIALARVAWALHLMLNVEMDLRRVAPAALAASGDPRFRDATESTARDVGRGRPLSEAYGRTGLFPAPFLDALVVAEESGQLVESMSRLSREYEAEAQRAVATLSALVGAAVWLLVALLLVSLVFRIFGFYTGAIYDALEQV